MIWPQCTWLVHCALYGELLSLEPAVFHQQAHQWCSERSFSFQQLLTMNQSNTFCTDPLWDSDLTWFTDDPDFTTCFHQTVLVYVPSLVLVLLSPIQLYLAKTSKDAQVPWSVLSISKFTFTAFLLGLAVIDLIWQISLGATYPAVFITTSVVKIITFAVVFGLQWICKRQGLVTSGVLLLFWTLSTVAGAFTYRSVISYLQSSSEPILPLITATIQYPLVIGAFFLACWADTPPKYIDVDGR